MTPLTKLQRYTAYCIMREEAESDNPSMFFTSENYNQPANNNGMCFMVRYLFEIPGVYSQGIMKEWFPELVELCPQYKINQFFHFNNWTERIKILDEAIAETEPR